MQSLHLFAWISCVKVGLEKDEGSLLNIDLHTPFQQFYIKQKVSSQIDIS
jgi:hypothetical protein